MRAVDYPGSLAVEPGMVDAGGKWTALGDAPVPDALRRGRTCVLAVGSNGSPQVLSAKLHAAGVDRAVVCVPYEVGGLAVAHSAHVSPGGYVATTPYLAPGGVVRVVASWFDAPQLAALDATEPNYDRRRLPGSVTGVPPGAQAYVSRWGVLAPEGEPLGATTQAAVHALLARDPVLSGLLPLADAEATAAALGNPALRVAVRQRLREIGWVRPAR